MLVQSHAGSVHLLPALPDVWKKGSVKGLRCRGGFTVEELNWEDNQLQTARITSSIGGTLRICTATPLSLNGIALKPVKRSECDNSLLKSQPIRRPLIAADAPINTTVQPKTYLYDIETVAGESYLITKEK